jgi:hypothetical protein
MPAARKTLFRYVKPWLLGGLVAIAAAAALPAIAKDEKERPVLQPWHTVVLKDEFHAGDAARIQTIADYQALETRLFAELDERVYGAVDPREKSLINRYWAGSNSDPRTSKPAEPHDGVAAGEPARRVRCSCTGCRTHRTSAWPRRVPDDQAGTSSCCDCRGTAQRRRPRSR